MMANVAVRNWRFLHQLGLTECQWFEGIGNSLTVRKVATFGTDPAVWHAFYNPGGGWDGPQNLGGSLASDPMAVTSSAGTVDVFFQGTNGSLWHVFYNPGSGWNTAVDLGMGTLGGAPFASGKPDGTVDVFWKGTGTDPALWHGFYNPGSGWTGPQDLGGSVG